MSSDESQSPLARAYDLVEAGQLDEARTLLESILDMDNENADAWWIYAHAVTDAETGRNALENVVRIDPTYPGAAELLAQAQEMAPPKPNITPLAPATMPEAPGAASDDGAPVPIPAARKTASAKPSQPVKPSSGRSAFPVIAIVAVIVIALVLLYLLLQSNGTPLATATPTQVVEAIASPTEASAAAATEVTTNAQPTAAVETTSEAGGIDYAAIEAALADFPIAESGIGVVDTSLGSTLLVTACTTPGREMRMLLPQVMNALAKQSASLGSGVVAIGARMLDCTQNAPLLTVATDLATAQSYAQGSLNDSDFAATWKPQ